MCPLLVVGVQDVADDCQLCIWTAGLEAYGNRSKRAGDAKEAGSRHD